MPEYADKETEAKISFCKVKMEEAIRSFTAKKQSEEENLTHAQKKGLDSLKQRRKEKEVICFPTDKSGVMSIDSPENYVLAMEPHIQGTTKVTQQDYDNSEKLLNSHIQSWCSILKFNERVSNNYQTTNNAIPPLYGLRKDHKDSPDIVMGPPTRPVCGAIVASNYRASHFISSIIKPVLNLAPEACNSTEDLLSRIEHINKNEDLTGCIIGSMDVDALYPSIDIEFAVDRCVDLILESGIEFKDVNINELGLYLALTEKQDTLRENNLLQYCPKRTTNKGRPPTITSSRMSSEEKRWEIWHKSNMKPNTEETRRMVCFALGVMMKVILRNHIFVFNNELYKQMNGGAIGVSTAGDIANLFMVWWDREFKKKINENNIEMKLYTRYVDDETVVCRAIPPDDDTEVDQQQADKRTMTKLQEIANNIHPSIQLKIDYPSNHKNNRLPILDTEQWIENIEVDGVMKHQILHSHYMKPMANKHVIHHDSAITYQSKINVLVADLVRVMRNVSKSCKPEERHTKIQEYITRMQYSGYTKKERANVYIKAKRRYDQILSNDRNNICPMYRSKTWNVKEREKEKANKHKNWFKKGGNETVFFVDATPYQELAKQCTEIFKNAELKVKVIEKSGRSIKEILARSDPFKANKCQSDSCKVCPLEGNINCKMREIVYLISCDGIKTDGNKCSDIKYKGETSRSIDERYGEHDYLYNHAEEGKRSKSVFYEHVHQEHGGINQPLKLDVIAHCPGDAMLRQVTEAVEITETKPILNSKVEWDTRNKPRKRKDQNRN